MVATLLLGPTSMAARRRSLVSGASANGLARLTWITSGYGSLALAVPVLAALPGNLSLGGLTMVVGAFNQVAAGAWGRPKALSDGPRHVDPGEVPGGPAALTYC